MAINTEWKIRSRSDVCMHTEKAFIEDEIIYTALVPEQDEEGKTMLARYDYSEAAWEELSAKLKPFSFWRSRYEPPHVEEEDEATKPENAESLLRRLMEEDLPSTENARYILAVMLERKKAILQTDVKEPREEEGSENRILIYEHKHTGEILLIRDPMLRLDQIEGVQEEVTTLLNGDKTPPASADESAPEDGAEDAPASDAAEEEE